MARFLHLLLLLVVVFALLAPEADADLFKKFKKLALKKKLLLKPLLKKAILKKPLLLKKLKKHLLLKKAIKPVALVKKPSSFAAPQPQWSPQLPAIKGHMPTWQMPVQQSVKGGFKA